VLELLEAIQNFSFEMLAYEERRRVPCGTAVVLLAVVLYRQTTQVKKTMSKMKMPMETHTAHRLCVRQGPKKLRKH
jgi:hypothetical protein